MNNLRQIEAGALRELELSNLPTSLQPAENIIRALGEGLINLGDIETERAVIAASIANQDPGINPVREPLAYNVALQNALTLHLIAEKELVAA